MIFPYKAGGGGMLYDIIPWWGHVFFSEFVKVMKGTVIYIIS